MATNAAVEKLKQFGLRHGEKLVVGLTSTLCLLFIGMAWSHPSIQITPDQLKKTADAAQANINRHQKTEDILAKLDNEKLVDPGFEKKVEDSKPGANANAASLYAFTGPSWVSPEPGAGLIRDMPELLAPYALHLNANRGAVLMYARKADTGEIEFEDPNADKPKFKVKKRRPRRGAMGGMGGMMGGMGGNRKTSKKKRGPSKAEIERQEAARAEEKNERLKAALEGEKEGELQVEKDKEDVAGDLKAKEITKGFRCVAIIGKLDHQKLVSNYVRALKDSNASPHYLRLDLQRQELDDDGAWGDWEDVDRDANQEIIKNTLEKEEELTLENVRLPGLVDDLPFFKAGYWYGVHVSDLVPSVKKKLAAPPKKIAGGARGGSGMMGGMMGGGMMGGGPGEMMGGMMGSGSSGMMGGAPPGMMGGEGGMRGKMGGSGMMGGMMGSGGMGGASSGAGKGPADTNYAKSDAKTLMIRGLDFTVEPDSSYRYRVRIVVRNPNYGWETVAPGVDKDSEEKAGPWSEPTDPVAIPDDVTTYAYQVSPDSKKGEKVSFQVARWTEDDGVTVVTTFDVEPGQIVGTKRNATVPAPDGKGTKAKTIDFTSHQLVLDTKGGARTLEMQGVQPRFEPPAIAVLMRSDGTLVVRDEAQDKANPEMRQMRNIYNQIVDDAKANKKKKSGGAMSGMMGGMMGGGGARGAN